jgi:hypothetical protein
MTEAVKRPRVFLDIDVNGMRAGQPCTGSSPSLRPLDQAGFTSNCLRMSSPRRQRTFDGCVRGRKVRERPALAFASVKML